MTQHGVGRPGGRWLWLSIASAMALAWAAGGGRPMADQVADPAAASESAEVEMGALGPVSEPTARGGRSADVPLIDDGATPCDPADSGPHVALKPVVGDRLPDALNSPIARALEAIDECQARYEAVRDYVCTFTKRERIKGRLGAPHVMIMKARTRPRSVYLKFRQPAAGREAIYIEGHHDGKVLAHDVGLGRLIAGTLYLDPTGSRAMADCRHPITEAGIGPLLNTLETRWSAELDASESDVDLRSDEAVDSRPCNFIQVTHTRQSPDFLFYRVRLYIDKELGLPIRFEAYDWPASPGAAPSLVEEYHYAGLKLNVGLSDLDFDVSNEDYAFGRF